MALISFSVKLMDIKPSNDRASMGLTHVVKKTLQTKREWLMSFAL